MKREIHIFFTALMFFTRIPCPKWVGHEPEYLEKSSKYFPLVGMIVGGIGALTFYLFQFVTPVPLAVLLSLAATIYTTGAFHEDGFADVCDGLGGGWTKEKILSIMKDSRLGTYGVTGLFLILGIKVYTLTQIPINKIPIVIIAGHSLSRFIATTLIYTHPYVRDTEGKAKPAAKKMNLTSLLIGAFFGILPLLYLRDFRIFICLVPVYLSKVYLGNKFKKWIGGQTGDCAGAVQQVSEVVFYISLLLLWKFI